MSGIDWVGGAVLFLVLSRLAVKHRAEVKRHEDLA
jgi:hypothetical protein